MKLFLDHRTVILVGIGVLVIFLGLELIFVQMKIRVIETIGPKQINILGLQKYKDQNLLFLDIKEEENNLYLNNPYLQSIILKKIYPFSLGVIYTLHKPIAFLMVNKGSVALSPNGRILYKVRGKLNNRDLPMISLYQLLDYNSIQPGTLIDRSEISKALFFLEKMVDLNLVVDNIDINGQNMILFNLNEQTIRISTEKDLEKQTYELQTIIRQFKIEGRKFKVLDLRFDKPIVTF